MNRNNIIYTFLLFCLTFSLSGQTRIKMKQEGGVYTVPCEVNGLKLRFILDTGASSVCISLTEVLFMLKNGYLDENDIIGSSQSQIADGSIVDNMQVILREIKIGNKKLTNVKAIAMHKLGAPLLLGQSAIQQLGAIKLDGDELVIVTKRKSTKTAKEGMRSTTSNSRSTRIQSAKTPLRDKKQTTYNNILFSTRIYSSILEESH